MRNILIVCHDYTLSGANMALLDYLKYADFKENHFFVLIPRKKRELAERLKTLGCEIWIEPYIVTTKHLYTDTLKEKLKQIIKYIYFIICNPFIRNRIVKNVIKNKIDIIHSNSFSVSIGVEIAQKTSVKHIWHIREFMEEDYQITHYNKNKIKFLAQYSNAIFISRALKDKYSEIYNFKKDTIIYDNVKYDELYSKKRTFMEDNLCNILMAGNLIENKGQEQAINAMKVLNNENIRLFICGTGPDELRLKKMVEKNNIKNVYFEGYVDNLTKYRKNIDIALVCSKSEGFGRITVEAMYYENLVIGANCGGTKELLSNDEGLLYELNNIKDLVQKIQYSINNRTESIKKIEKAKEIALKNFNKNIFKKIDNFYKEIEVMK